MDAVSPQVFSSAFDSFPLLPDIRTDFSTDQLVHSLNEAFRIGYGIIVEPASRVEIQLFKAVLNRASLIPPQKAFDFELEAVYRLLMDANGGFSALCRVE